MGEEEPMTTAAIDDIATHPDLQDETVPEPQTEAAEAPRKRGRPKGSRNKPRETTATTPAASKPRATRTPRATNQAATTTTAVAPVTPVGDSARVVLIEDSGVTVVTEHGSSTYKVEPQFVLDRRTK